MEQQILTEVIVKEKSNILNLSDYFKEIQFQNNAEGSKLSYIRLMVKKKGFKNIFNILEEVLF